MKIVITGKSASGKTHLKDRMVKRGLKFGISYTTRKPRKEEEDGVDYYFISKEEFLKLIEGGEMYEWVDYNGEYYGRTKKVFVENDLFVMEPLGVKSIKKNLRKDCFIIYVDIDETILFKRMIERGMPVEEVLERINRDKEFFKNFKNFDLVIKNEDF
jgi:guanylate kinase